MAPYHSRRDFALAWLRALVAVALFPAGTRGESQENVSLTVVLMDVLFLMCFETSKGRSALLYNISSGLIVILLDHKSSFAEKTRCFETAGNRRPMASYRCQLRIG